MAGGRPGGGAARAYTAPAVDRALDILEFMAGHPQPYGATELSRCLNIPLNSVFRILKRLTERDYAIAGPALGRLPAQHAHVLPGNEPVHAFRPAPAGAAAPGDGCAASRSRPARSRCRRATRLLVLDTVSPEVQYYIRVVPGAQVHYHPNAYGKAVLAFLEDGAVRKLLPSRLTRLTPHTIVQRGELVRQLQEVRRTGIAYDNEEYNEGIRCIGAPVFDAQGGVVAGLGVTGFVSAFRGNRQAGFEHLVLDCAARLSKDIGYTGRLLRRQSAPPVGVCPGFRAPAGNARSPAASAASPRSSRASPTSGSSCSTRG